MRGCSHPMQPINEKSPSLKIVSDEKSSADFANRHSDQPHTAPIDIADIMLDRYGKQI